jgi:hypothetical protein
VFELFLVQYIVENLPRWRGKKKKKKKTRTAPVRRERTRLAQKEERKERPFVRLAPSACIRSAPNRYRKRARYLFKRSNNETTTNMAKSETEEEGGERRRKSESSEPATLSAA